MDKTAKILVTGGSGMVGGALLRSLRQAGFTCLMAPSHAELDLCSRAQTIDWVSNHRPEHVFMVAAKVGGIAANAADPVGFLDTNARMALNLFEACRHVQTKKNLFLGSSCIYPRDCPQPMREDYLLTGPLEPTNEGYALAKILGLTLARAYWKQFGMKTISLMPSNVYGTGDHFDLKSSHVLSALVRRFVDAQDQRLNQVTLWGSGVARREFLHVDDLVRGILFAMERYEDSGHLNIGPGTDISIRELAVMIAREVGYEGAVAWDPTKPDGMPRKCMDISSMRALGFEPTVSLETGVRKTIEEYRQLKARGAIQ